MLRIVMDSAGDIPSKWDEMFDINIIPLNIHFGERTFLQGVDLSNSDFYRMVDEGGIFPKTSQPSPQQFIAFYKQIAQPGDDIISLHVTGKLSGTLASAQMASRELEGEYNVYPIDSKSGSAAMGYMCREARLLNRAGRTTKEIIEALEAIAAQVRIILTLDTLEYARRSGRVKALQAALASLLNVKPIVELSDGVLELGDRVRTRSKALSFVIDKIRSSIGNNLANVAVVHAEDPKSAEILIEKVRDRLNCRELITTELSIGVAANLGPGTVGVIAYPVTGGG